MKLAFSNIAWTPHDDASIFSLLRKQGVTGIEVAPTKVWPNWEGATPAAAERYGNWLRSCGFEIPALQAVLFGRPEARLFDRDGEVAFVSHLTHVAELAGALGASTVVLGAPRQRDRGSLSMEEAFDRAADVLHGLAGTFAARGTCLCIEPNPRRYACNFVVNASEGAELVRRVDHPGFKLHLDAAAMFLEGEDPAHFWPHAGGMVRHFHISEPELADFCNPQVPHRANLDFLGSSGYAGWCSVEMREPVLPLAVSGPWSILRATG
jgi:D-psicose/D-tagatose/L-ribulose 3-epimerase